VFSGANARFEASGTVQSLLNYSILCPKYSFYRLFQGEIELVTPPKLTA
jgi:hypothetical protein